MPKKWKPVAIDDNFAIENIEGLIGLEVLEDCDASVVKGSAFTIKKGTKRKKQQKDPPKKAKALKSKSDDENMNTSGQYVRAPTENNENNFMEEMEAWKPHGIRIEILRALHEKGFLKPTNIQERCIHGAVTSKKADIVGVAETGSGKTYAFGIPVVQTIMQLKEDANETNRNELYAIVVTPTRELAVQVKDHLIQICKYTGIHVALVVGGLAKEKQERILNKKPEIVVGTPGRLWELFSEGNTHLLNIPSVRMLVVDEADRMLEKSHFAELGCLLEKINADEELRETRRNFVFSATLTVVHEPPSYHKGKKKKPKDKLKELLSNIGVKNELIYDLSVKKFTPENLSEWKVLCEFAEKDYYLLFFLVNNPGRCMIFCNSIGCVKRLANLLTILHLKPYPLHANMEQKQRLRNLEKFRDDNNGILLATDVAARGLDIPQVGHVVHYQVPRTAESYVHRSGRTARGTNLGATLLLVSIEEKKLYNKLMKTLNREIGVEDLEVQTSDLTNIKNLVHLARDIDQMDLALKRKSSKEKWFEKAAKDMDLFLDDDELPEKTSDLAVKKVKKELTYKQKELAGLLKSITLPRFSSGKFPDMNFGGKQNKMRPVNR